MKKVRVQFVKYDMSIHEPVLVDRIAFGGLLYSIAGCLIQTIRKRKAG